ncbi:MAG: hypothetical protein H6739_04080 [Alphaproteobacteria bacterium]|nr:hypothetical protein [Alphaproteobacteria bacterium]
MEERPLLPHLPSEFLTWLWFTSEQSGGSLKINEEFGSIDFWVDDRIAFRSMEDEKPRTVLTGENPSTTLEAHAALAGGRIVKELRLAVKREDREYSVNLKGPYLDFQGARLPTVVKGAAEEVLYDRMYCAEELTFIVGALLTRFAQERTSEAWYEETLPAMKAWVSEGLGGQGGDTASAG